MWDIDFNRLRDVFVYDPQAPMIFSSGIFLWLFAAFILVYLLLQHRLTARLLFVTAFSYYFYYKSSGTYFFLLALVTVSDFFIARFMAGTSVGWKRKASVVLSLAINLGLLAYFKYTNFLGDVFASLLGGTFHHYDIFLPVGISFFTFQSLSYTIDVYCWIMLFTYPSSHNWWQVLLYVPVTLSHRYAVLCSYPMRCSEEVYS